jgi:aldehyde:ferredoxin oxidoreductase
MDLYAGKVLTVDLTNTRVYVEPLRKEWLKNFWGSWGLAVRYFWEEVDPSVDPLSAENVMVLMTGPLTGTSVPMTSRLSLVSKSPLTGTIFQSNVGGSFGPELKYAGFDGIVIKGRSDAPVYLRIEDSQVSIESADELVGRGIFETEKRLEKTFRFQGAKCLAIGPAGENLLPYSIVGSDAYRQFGRGGAGALFGSKNLKGIVCRGTGGVRVADMDLFLERCWHHQQANLMSDDHLWIRTDGTPGNVDVMNEIGILPARNFTKGTYEKYSKINSEALDLVKLYDRACFSCPMACGKYTRIGDSAVEGPEYETLCLAGSNCDIDDLGSIIEFNRLCDDLGLDTMSAGATISLAMEMTEKGRADFTLKFGDAKELLQVIYEIAHRSTQRGQDLAMGSKALAKKYNSQDLSMEIKGMELPAYDPRGNYGMGLAYATSERGACHLRAYTVFSATPFDLEMIAQEVVDGQNLRGIKWSMCLCEFWDGLTLQILSELLSAGLGEKITVEELSRSGERVWNLTRLFNLRAGFTGKDDSLPEKVMKRKLEKGPHAGRVFSSGDFEKAKQIYYRLRDWDEKGVPSQRKLKSLGLLGF